ncbi:RNA ligase family protein [Deinococcus soli (ex Cha et al. 2016)]|uniref:Uncharacterized protein n=2 Tax=Deinococcus soli (ex Cha et al. 2016) TaxID=1309411 RepID=A0ACC6KFY1_9DEIO|nr:RNA ligase family protein [Deinococcus soli (ex Cha et al. 2016)]MDR6218324.1 hypothetical protein [Deinococcus soli (ex Cha et al. 2016)]MDR6329064.1 hypothetical protein [Deinococcus soli (ex Cha et al. 2016)]MDR6751337.1 hypothetical protein [Deinococcus soli (ex Cha et al. 2016)]
MNIKHEQDLVVLTRDTFRALTFDRDGHRCVVCGRADVKLDAHHILERRLFRTGGYFLDNAVSLCDQGEHGCHMRAERTLISPDELRERAGIGTVVLPDHLYADATYTKWGDIVLEDGRRVRGELFEDESVQKVLRDGGVLPLYTNRVKYPRTPHLPWSPGKSKDDRIIETLSHFHESRVICTIKRDGENTTMLSDGLHARSIDGRHHPSRNWVKNFHASIAHELPDGWRIAGENLYAQHTIRYDDLPSYFMGISIWDERNTCLPWDDTLAYFGMLGITPVPVVYDGPWPGERFLRDLADQLAAQGEEGYVIRRADAFAYRDFRLSVAKYVTRTFKDAVNASGHHWRAKAVVPNGLKPT